MRKKLLFLLLFCTVMVANAENVPTITLCAEVNNEERTLGFEVSTPNTKLFIDWGDGVSVETDIIQMPDPYANATEVTGTPKGDGVIKIYGDNIVYFSCTSVVGKAQVTSVDVTKAVELTELYVNTNKLTSIDVSKNTKLQKFYCHNNPITSLDISKNSALTYLNANEIEIDKLDISKCPELESLYCNLNKLKEIDISQNAKLKHLYCTNNQIETIDPSQNPVLSTLSISNNLLTSIDVTACSELKMLMCTNNQISELKVGKVGTRFNCDKNHLTFSTLPSSNYKNYLYAPQADLIIAEDIFTGEEVDLSAQDNIKGITDKEQKTTYTWKTIDNETTLEAGKDYTENNGRFIFLTVPDQPVYCEMASNAFPGFSGTKAFKTTPIKIKQPTGVNNNVSDNIIIVTEKGKVIIKGLQTVGNIQIYTMNGVKTADTEVSSNTMTFTLDRGSYIIRIDNKIYKTIIL